MSDGELIKKARARAILKCSYPRLQGYEDAGELEALESEDGTMMYRLSEVEALAQSNSDVDASVSDAVGQVTRMIRGFEKHTQELLKLAIEPVKLVLAQWEAMNKANATTREKLEEENQRLRDKYHGVLVKFEEMLDGEAQRKLEEAQMMASEKRKDNALEFFTQKAGPTLVDQVKRTIGIKTKAQPLLDLVDRMGPDQITVLLNMELIDKVQAEALCELKGLKLEDIINVGKKDARVPGPDTEETSNGGGPTSGS